MLVPAVLTWLFLEEPAASVTRAQDGALGDK